MAIPWLSVPEINFHHANTTLDHAQGHKAAPAKIAASVSRARGFAFLRDIKDLRRLGLHPERDFHGLNRAFELGLAPQTRKVGFVQACEEVKLAFLLGDV